MAKMSIKNVVLDAASELYHEDWLFSVLEWAAQIALSARPGVDVECDHVFVGDHTEEGGVMCVKCGVDIYDTPPAPSDWESEVYVVWTVDAAGGIVVRKVFDDRHTASLYRSGIHDIVCHITTARMFRSKVLTTSTSDPKGPEEG